MKRLFVVVGFFTSLILTAANPWVTYEPKSGAADAKHIVLLSGDEEYRSEESLPMLAKILSERHGFRCTVLFPINPSDGSIDPNNQTNIPGMSILAKADLVIDQFRFRELPDADMAYFDAYLNTGKPMMVVRTATHSFAYSRNKNSRFAKYDWGHKGGVWTGGFGGRMVGETWTYHHGDHGKEATRGIVDGKNREHPILRGVTDVFGLSDVYGVNADFPNDATILMHGQVLVGMKPDDAPNVKKAVMPLVWLRDYRGETGNMGKMLCTTIGAAVDLQSEDLRRLFVNACYWLTKGDVPKNADVRWVGEYTPSMFGFNKAKMGVRPEVHATHK